MDPNFDLNFGVPELSEEEVVVACYMQTEMADKLNNAAMRAARLRAELKEKSLGVPPPPKVSLHLFDLMVIPSLSD